MYQANRRQTYYPDESYKIKIRAFLGLNASEDESSQLQGIRPIGKECNEEDRVDSVGEEAVPTETKNSRKRARMRSIGGGGFVKLILSPVG